MPKTPTERSLKRILQEVVAETGVPGITAVVISHGVETSAHVGLAVAGSKMRLTETSRFEISCLMKFFVSLAAIASIKDGPFNLGAPVANILPELTMPDEVCITLAHLLSHSSGYRGLDITDMRVRWGYSWPQFVAHFKQTGQLFEPGVVFNYEHSEHVIVGEMLRRLSGRSAPQLVSECVLEPLGIQPIASGESKAVPAMFVGSHGYSSQSGRYEPIHIPPLAPFWETSLPDWTLTVAEIAKVGASLLRNGHKAANSFALALLAHPFITLPRHARSEISAEVLPVSFGAGCACYADGALGHNGSGAGQTCGLRIHPDDDLVVAVGVNAWSPRARDAVLRRLLGRGEPTEQTESHDPSFTLDEISNAFDLTELAGHYVGGFLGEAEVRYDGRELACEVGTAGRRRQVFRIVPDDGGRYAIRSEKPVSVAFTAVGGQPVLSLGMHAYKKVSRGETVGVSDG